MSKLKPRLPLEGYAREWDTLALKEHYVGEMVSLAVSHGNSAAFSKVFKTTFGKAPPKASKLVTLKNGFAMLSGADQYLILLAGENNNADKELSQSFTDTAYATLQTDGWASLKLTGPQVYDVLERFTALDLRNAPTQYAARTMAHHMAIIVMKSSETEFQLLTPRSSAHSFLEALTHTIDNVMSSSS